MKNKFILLLLLLIAFGTNAQQNDFTLHLEQGDVVLHQNIKTILKSNAILDEDCVDGFYYRYLQFQNKPNQDTRQDIEKTGLRLLEYLPSQTYVAAIPKNLAMSDLTRFNLRCIQPIASEHKLSKELLQPPYGEWAIYDDKIDVVAQYPENLSLATVKRCFEKLPFVEILQETTLKNVFVLRIPITQMMDLAAMPYISHIEMVPPPSEKEDLLGRSLHRSNILDSEYDGGYKYDGKGLKVLIRDDGQVGPHIDFTGRLDQHLCPTGPTAGSHGDMTSGILCGAGNIDPNIKGHAPGAFLYIVDYKADFLDSTLRLHTDYGVVVTSTSYSDGCNKGYTNNAQTIDKQLFTNPNLIHVFSAGNANSTNCGYGAGDQWGNITGGHKMSKNSVACANLGADAIIDTTSSRGPTTDGRIKPDISANGRNQLSTDTNNKYQVGGGTSAAAPSVAGCMTQLYHAYKTLNNNKNAEGALLKAVMLNTANDIGPKGPDYRFGWGIVNSYRALKALEDKRYLNADIDQNDERKFILAVPTGTKQVRVMLYWADVPAAINAKTALVNDLDLSVIDPSGTKQLPYILSYAPDATQLAKPATRGEDHINNMEQVYFENPAAGNYEVTVRGFNVPVGAQKFYIVYEIIEEDFKITYPNGGEKWEPGQNVRIHWDTYSFTNENFKIEYSPNNGTSWTSIGNVSSGKRMFDWTTSKVSTAKGLIRLTRGNNTVVNTVPFSIMDTPNGIKVTEVCKGKMTIKWDVVDSANAYVVYKLGKQYMDVIDTVKTNQATISITNPFDKYWLTVSALGKDGMRSDRSLAISYSGGILNCVVKTNTAALVANTATEKAIFSCNPVVEKIKIPITNTGKDTVTSCVVYYKKLNSTDTIVKQIVLDTILPGKTINVLFDTPITLSKTENTKVDLWVKALNDEIAYDDTLHFTYKTRINPTPIAAAAYKESFEGSNLPKDLIIENNDNDRTWVKSVATGSNSTSNQAFSINNFGYANKGTKDAFYLPSITIPNNANSTFLNFDVAYIRYDNTRFDTLMVEALTDCGAKVSSIVYVSSGIKLATVGNTSATSFVPSSVGVWRNEVVDLSAYKGQNITLRFTNINYNGNNLYIDNIRFANETVAKPKAAFTINNIDVCRGVVVNIASTSTGGGLSYNWSFGPGSSISTANTTGAFPISYSSSGVKTVTLIVSNGLGSDTLTQTINVKVNPTPSFTSVLTSGTLTCTNTSKNSDTYAWDFGDTVGKSTELSPTYSYKKTGNYTVRLTAYNACGNNFTTRTIAVIVSADNDINASFGVNVEPNPSSGIVSLELKAAEIQGYEVEMQDIRGAILQRKSLTPSLQIKEQFDLTAYAKGLYFMKIKNEKGSFKTMKIVIN